ncbi:MAK10-like protein, partial [Tanacetum coccineum]
NDVPPPPTGLFAPPTIDLSNSGLKEFQQPEFEGYGFKANKGVCENSSNEIKKTTNAPIIEDWVSDCDEDDSKVMVLKSDNVQHKPEQANQPKKNATMFVSISLRDQASNWLERLPAESISTWEDLTTRFLAEFFPPGRTARLLNDILMRTIYQSAGGKIRDMNAEESWVLIEDLALYDNERGNDPRDFAKWVKAISLPQDVPSTSDCRLIELENQVQRLIEAHLAPKSSNQVNKSLLHVRFVVVLTTLIIAWKILSKLLLIIREDVLIKNFNKRLNLGMNNLVSPLPNHPNTTLKNAIRDLVDFRTTHVSKGTKANIFDGERREHGRGRELPPTLYFSPYGENTRTLNDAMLQIFLIDATKRTTNLR